MGATIRPALRVQQQEPLRERHAMKLASDKVAALKTATKLLITELGGLAAAASACRVSVPVLSEYTSVNHPDRTMPIDVVLQLEAVLGVPVVTAALARLNGRSLAEPAVGAIPCVGRAVAAVTRHAGAAAAAFMEAAADGQIDRTEAADMTRLLEAVREHAGEALAALSAQPALRVVA